MRGRSPASAQLLLILAFLLPVLLLFLLPGMGLMAAAHWLWFVLLLCFVALLFMTGGPVEDAAIPERPERRMLAPEQQPENIREVMDVEVATEEPAGVRIFRGRLRTSAAVAYNKLKQALTARTVPMVQGDEQSGAAILLMPKPVEEAVLEKPVRPWVNWLLFVLTVITTTSAGAAHQGVNLFREPERFTAGLPYAVGLPAILGVHELGHYFTARRHKMRVTLPYFIPVTFALGTFGAFIQMKFPPEHRRALFDVAVAAHSRDLLSRSPRCSSVCDHQRS